MTSKQRAYLRGLANNLDPILHIGKDGITENTVRQADEALAARELMKATVQKTCAEDVRAVADALSQATGAQSVQIIGRRFVLYRPAEQPVIQLPWP